MGASGSGAPRKGAYRLPGAAEETDAKGGQTASAAWAGTAQRSERGTGVDAGYQGERERALTFEYWYTATTLMRAGRWNGGRTMMAVRPGKTVLPAQGVAGSTWAGRVWVLWDGRGPAPC